MKSPQIFRDSTAEVRENNVYLERPRIEKLLETAMKSPLVALCAGSGYGKTHAVYAFLKKRGDVTIWLQASVRDNISARIWEQYTNLIARYNEAFARQLKQSGFPKKDKDIAKYIALLRGALRTDKRYVVVLDDFHLIQNPEILRFIEQVAKPLPRQVTLILISRTAPEGRWIELMSQGQMVSINEEDLQFTRDEIAAYVQQLGLSIRQENIEEIYSSTKGWAFAVNLVGRTIRRAPAYENSAVSNAKANIFKLIEKEIFLGVSENLRRFLVQLSLIEHFAVPLIERLAGDEALLGEFKNLHAYIRYDAYLNAYLIHHLLLDFLREKQDMLSEEIKQFTYAQAGLWCEKNKYKIDAVFYYEKAGNYNGIISIVYRFSTQVPADVAQHILPVFQRMPPGLLKENPNLVSMHLRLLRNVGALKEAYQTGLRYERRLLDLPETQAVTQALAGLYTAMTLIRQMLSTTDDVYDFDRYVAKRSKVFSKHPYTVAGPSAQWLVGPWVSFVGVDRPGALEEFNAAARRAAEVQAHPRNRQVWGMGDLAEAELLFYQNRLPEAEERIGQSIAKTEETNQWDLRHRALFYRMRIAFAQGDLPKAEQALGDMEVQLQQEDYLSRRQTYDIAQGWYYLALRQEQSVPEWLRGDFAQYRHPSFPENFSNSVKALYCYGAGQYPALLSYLAEQRGRETIFYGRLEARVLEAVCLYQCKRKEEALAVLEEAYAMAHPCKITMPFLEMGKDMRTLTSAALRKSTQVNEPSSSARQSAPIPRGWLEQINKKANTYAKRQTHMAAQYRQIHYPEGQIALSHREKQVLEDLLQGLSRSEIAQAQNLSVNTVKMVLDSIYSKLGVDHLVELVRVAVEQKLV